MRQSHLGDIDSAGADAFARTAIEHQIHAAIHHAEDFDAAAAGGTAGNIGAGGDDRLIQPGDQFIGNPALAPGEPPAARCFPWRAEALWRTRA